MRRRRGTYDAVIDFQNGIPFFAPLFAGRRTAVVLVIHHVHQEQFAAALPLAGQPGRAGARGAGQPRRLPAPPARGRVALHPAGRPAPAAAARARPRGAERADRARRSPWTAGPSPFPHVVVVSRLVSHKRFDLLLDAVAALRAAAPRPAGRHGRRRARARGARSAAPPTLGLGDVVRFHGFAPARDRATGCSSAAWLTVSPSQAEGWGLTVVEANAVGVPAVGFAVQGLRDSVVDGVTGWLVPEGGDLAAGHRPGRHPAARPRGGRRLRRALPRLGRPVLVGLHGRAAGRGGHGRARPRPLAAAQPPPAHRPRHPGRPGAGRHAAARPPSPDAPADGRRAPLRPARTCAADTAEAHPARVRRGRRRGRCMARLGRAHVGPGEPGDDRGAARRGRASDAGRRPRTPPTPAATLPLAHAGRAVAHRRHRRAQPRSTTRTPSASPTCCRSPTSRSSRPGRRCCSPRAPSRPRPCRGCVAQALSGGPRARLARRQVVWFGVLANTRPGPAGRRAPRAARVPLRPADARRSCSAGRAFLVFLSSSTVGLLQADRRFGALGGLRVAETAAQGRGRAHPGRPRHRGHGRARRLRGRVDAARRRRDGLRPPRHPADRGAPCGCARLWRSAAGVGSVQALVSVLSAADLVLVAVLVPAGAGGGLPGAP